MIWHNWLVGKNLKEVKDDGMTHDYSNSAVTPAVILRVSAVDIFIF